MKIAKKTISSVLALILVISVFPLITAMAALPSNPSTIEIRETLTTTILLNSSCSAKVTYGNDWLSLNNAGNTAYTYVKVLPWPQLGITSGTFRQGQVTVTDGKNKQNIIIKQYAHTYHTIGSTGICTYPACNYTLLWPVDPKSDDYWIKSLDYYPDNTAHGNGKAIDIYSGLDVGASKDPYAFHGYVYAVASGVVINSSYNCTHWNARGTGTCGHTWGDFIEIAHPDGSTSLYMHLKPPIYSINKITLYEGMQVTRGQLIGEVGSSGESSGPHLHYQFLGTKDPATYNTFDRYKDRFNNFWIDADLVDTASKYAKYIITSKSITTANDHKYYGWGGPGSGGNSGVGGSSVGDDTITWPDPLGNPDPLDFYLVPQTGKNPNSTDGKYISTHGAYRNADSYYNPSWIVGYYDDGSKATFGFSSNTTTNARDCSVRHQLGDRTVTCLRFLQCCPVQPYTATIPSWGGSYTVTLPYGYQYIEYGSLACENKPVWVNTPVFKQNSGRMPTADGRATVTISADYSRVARSGTVYVTIGNTRDGTYRIASIEVTQDALPAGYDPGDMNVAAPETDMWIGPSNGYNGNVTYGSMIGSEVKFEPENMFTNKVITDRYATFTITENTANNGRQGNVYTWTGYGNQTVRFFQCGKSMTNNVNFPPEGGESNVLMAYMYQFKRYGTLVHPYHPNWLSSIELKQSDDMNKNATVTLKVGVADYLRQGSIPIYFGNSRDGTFEIATINVIQSGRYPTGISISPSSITLEPGETKSLTAVLMPTNAQNKTVTWSSNKTDVATVSSTGVVKGVSPGKATITAKTANSLTATCTVTVIEPEVPIELEISHFVFEDQAEVLPDTQEISSFGVSSLSSGMEDNLPTERKHLDLSNLSSYQITYASNWIRYEKDSSGMWIWCDKNTSANNRTGTLVIDAEGFIPATITIKQKGTELTNKDYLLDALITVANYQEDWNRYNIDSYILLMTELVRGAIVYFDLAASQVAIDDAADAIFDAINALKQNLWLGGKIMSYDTQSPINVQLLLDGEIVVYELNITEDSGIGQILQYFTFKGIESGTYDILITKPRHTSFMIKSILVGDEDVELANVPSVQCITLPCGDINGDGMINDGDLTELWKLSNYNRNIEDEGVNEMCDLNGDGMINDVDLTILWMISNYNKGPVVITP